MDATPPAHPSAATKAATESPTCACGQDLDICRGRGHCPRCGRTVSVHGGLAA